MSKDDFFDGLEDEELDYEEDYQSELDEEFNSNIHSNNKLMNKQIVNDDFNDENYLKCPCLKCQERIKIHEKLFACENQSCDFKVWKIIAQRELKANEVEELILKGKTKKLAGFISKVGKEFSAIIELDKEDDYKTKFVFETDNNKLKVILNDLKSLNINCPKCGGDIKINDKGDNPNYICENRDLIIWKKIGGRLMSDSEIKKLIKDKKLAKLDGFISKSNKKYSMALELLDDGKVNYVFC